MVRAAMKTSVITNSLVSSNRTIHKVRNVKSLNLPDNSGLYLPGNIWDTSKIRVMCKFFTLVR